ncbi:MAG: hypothetical protein J5843_01365 [Clostridia bacterium]|nr:hypothetical protein [Clostridia bacterium]
MNERDLSEWRARLLNARAEGHAWSWKDASFLAGIRDALRSVDPHRDGEDLLYLSESVAEELGAAYEEADRMAYAAEFYSLAVRLMAEQARRFGDGSGQMAPILVKAVRARNYYSDDDCGDLRSCAAVCLGDAADDVMDYALSERRVLIHDPVESTAAYLNVIDVVEEKLESAFGGRTGSPGERWTVKKGILDENGIRWRSPADCNPSIRFC